MVSTSAGMRCPECAFSRASLPVAAAQTGSVGLAALAGLLTGLAGAYVLALFALTSPLLSLLAAPLYGRLVADAIKSFNENSKRIKPEALGVGSIAVGSLIAFGLPLGMLRTVHGAMPEMAQAMVGMAIGLSVAICYHHLKQRPS